MIEPTKQVSVDLFKDLVTCVGVCVIFVTANPEAATQDVYKKRVSKISQNLLENTHARVSFLINLQTSSL